MHFDSALTDVNDDKLGRKEFAVQIANGLVKSFANNHESIVIGINGEWGSGKSTLVNFVIQEIDNLTKDDGEDKPVIIRFNPWMFSGQKELQTIFLREMYFVMKRDLGFLKKHAKKLAPVMDGLGLLVNSMVLITNPALVPTSSRIVDAAKKTVDGANKVEDIHKLKESIDKSIIEAKLKIYITVDDIDRLSPTEITEILQMVKLNANFANTVFLLCYDYDVVISALKNKFGENGEKYLEKIVQVDYTLPHISKDKIKELFVEEIGKLFENKGLNKELKEFVEKDELILPFFSTLRDMYRFLNAVKLRLEFIHEELNVGDFLLIETLRIFDKKAYQFVLNSSDILIRNYQESLQERKDRILNISELEQASQKSIKIIKRCFYLDTSTVIYDYGAFRGRMKGIGDKPYFARYFSLNLSINDIPEKYYKDYFISENKVKILEEVNSNYSLFNYMMFLKRRLKSIKDIKETCFIIFTFMSNYNQPSNKDITINYDLWDLLKRIGSEEARPFLLEILNTNPFNNYHLKICSDILYNYREKKSDNYYFLLRKDEQLEGFIIELRKVYNDTANSILQKVIKNHEMLYKIEFKHFIFYTIYEVEEHSKKLKAKFIELGNLLEDKDLLFVLDNTMKLMQASNYSQISERHSFRIIKSLFPYWLESDYVKDRLDNLDKENLTLEEQNLIKVFYMAYENNFDENKYYDFETGTDVSEHFRRGR
ncbi:P-loop NTPase fold protein [Bernardetia sp. Wsw4-3y2]|uniref:KAP family P-loop NTPase fold protein n=1 Tax=Bernardetia sp. Wsw4-3y2 TaxID=3127471 RepID=UPI0030CF6533